MSDGLFALLDATVKAALAGGADDAEASYAGRRLGTPRFANSYFTQAGVIEEDVVRVRAARGKRIGAARTGILESSALAETARIAAAAAEHQPPTDAFPGFTRPSDATPEAAPQAHVEATASFGPGDRAAILTRAFERAARSNLHCAGVFTTAACRQAVVTSTGLALSHRYTTCQLSLIALDSGASGYAGFYGGDVAALDADAVVDTAIETAARARDPVSIDPAPMDVVLAPEAVSELLEWMAIASFSARGFLDESSFLAGNYGKPLCNPAVTIRDDWRYAHPSTVPIPFDSEGMPRRAVTLIGAGKGGSPVTHRGLAARLGLEPTGHAPPLGEYEESPAAGHLVFEPGDAGVDDLVSRVERGLYVTRLHYVNGLLDTRRAVMTGLTRDGTFLIENGKRTRPVEDLRFTDSLLDGLGPRLGGVGRDLRAVPTTWSDAGYVLAPHVLIRGLRFTGSSR